MIACFAGFSISQSETEIRRVLCDQRHGSFAFPIVWERSSDPLAVAQRVGSRSRAEIDPSSPMYAG
jgi:hypothetical protein